MKCKCGYVFQFDIETEDYEQCLLPLKFVEQMEDDLRDKGLTGEEFADRFAMNRRNVHPCPECGRVYIETRPRSKSFECYVKEGSEP
jgi:hypothetical protein